MPETVGHVNIVFCTFNYPRTLCWGGFQHDKRLGRLTSMNNVLWQRFSRVMLTGLLAAGGIAPAAAQDARSVLFIRGADRSGGFLEAGNDAERTEQLADISNNSTANGNHGWKELADFLRSRDFAVTQITESVEPHVRADAGRGDRLRWRG